MFGFKKKDSKKDEEVVDRPSRALINENIKGITGDTNEDLLIKSVTDKDKGPEADDVVSRVYYTKQLHKEEIQRALNKQQEDNKSEDKIEEKEGNVKMGMEDRNINNDNTEVGSGFDVLARRNHVAKKVEAEVIKPEENLGTSNVFNSGSGVGYAQAEEVKPVNNSNNDSFNNDSKGGYQPAYTSAPHNTTSTANNWNNNPVEVVEPVERKSVDTYQNRNAITNVTKCISTGEKLDTSRLQEISYRAIDSVPYDFDFKRDPQGRLCAKVEEVEDRLKIGTLPLDLIGIPTTVIEILNHDIIEINGRKYATSNSRIISPEYKVIREEIGRMISTFTEAVFRCKTTHSVNGHIFDSYILNKFEIESLLGSFPGISIKKWIDPETDDLIIKFGDFQSKI